MRPPARAGVLAVLLVSVSLFASCSFRGGPSGPATPDAASIDCGGAAASVSGDRRDVTVVGVCPRVEIQGTDLRVDLRGAGVQELRIDGDRNDVLSGATGATVVAGQDNTLAAEGADALAIDGDRNDVSATGELGRVEVAGSDNSVEASAIGGTVDQGERNEVRTR
jgi:hypothetical protein